MWLPLHITVLCIFTLLCMSSVLYGHVLQMLQPPLPLLAHHAPPVMAWEPVEVLACDQHSANTRQRNEGVTRWIGKWLLSRVLSTETHKASKFPSDPGCHRRAGGLAKMDIPYSQAFLPLHSEPPSSQTHLLHMSGGKRGTRNGDK